MESTNKQIVECKYKGKKCPLVLISLDRIPISNKVKRANTNGYRSYDSGLYEIEYKYNWKCVECGRVWESRTQAQRCKALNHSEVYIQKNYYRKSFSLVKSITVEELGL